MVYGHKWLHFKYLDCRSFAVVTKTSEWGFPANIYIYKTSDTLALNIKAKSFQTPLIINLWMLVCQPAGMCFRKAHAQATGAALCCLGEGTPHSSP